MGLGLYVVVGLGIAALGGAMRAARQRAEADTSATVLQREELRTTLASIGDAVIVTDAGGRVVSLNPVAESLTGWATASAVGKPLEAVFVIVKEQTRQKVESPVTRVLKEGLVVGLANSTVLIAKDGTERPIDDSAAPIRHAGGRLGGVILVFRDVTDRRRAEQAHRRLAAIVESSDDAIVSKSLDGLITNWNAGAERMYGYTAAEVIGKPFSILVPPDRTDEVQESARRLQRGERLDHFETVRRHKGGSLIDVSVSYSPIKDGEGLIVGTAVITRDTSERKRAERRRNARLAVTQALAEAGDLTEACPRILRAVCEGLGWGVGALWLVDRQADCICCFGLWHLPSAKVEKFEAATRQGRFRRDDSLPGRVWASGKPLWMADVATDEQFMRRHAAAEEGLHGGFACPVYVEDEVSGVIEFFSGEIREPDPDLLEMTATLGGQIGQFIQRKRAEEELRRSEQELGDFFENATVGLHWVGPDGTILRVNRAELGLLGYEREEYVGRHIAEFHADQPVIEDILRRLHAGEPLHDCPARMRCKDGSIRDVLIDSSVRWKDGQFLHTRCFTRDVTAQKRAEEASRERERQLAESERRFRTLTDHAPVGIFLTDAQGNCLFVNRRWCEMAGLSSEEAQGQGWGRALHPEDRDRIFEEWYTAARAGREFVSEYRFRTPQGKVTWLRAGAAALRDEAGDPVGFVGTVMDTTEQRIARAALEESEERFRAAVNQAAVGVALVGPDSRTLFVNRGLCEMLGYTEAELLAGSFIDVTHPDDLHLDYAQMPRLMSGEATSCRYEKRYRHKGGSVVWADLSVAAVRGEQGDLRYVVGVLVDITARKEAHEALREGEERLRLALEAGRMGVWDWNIHTDEIKWSENLEPVHGLAPGTFGGTLEAFQKLIHPDDRELASRTIARSLEERASYDIEFRNLWPDGSVHWMSGKGRVFTGDDGRPARMIGVGIDITARKRAEQDTKFLADASAALAGLVDYESTLQKVARLAVPHFADWATVDMLDEGGTLRRVAVAHVNPAKVELAHDLHRRYPPDPSTPQGVWHVVRTGNSEIIPEITDDLLVTTVKDADLLRIMRELGLRSYMGVPLSVRGKVLGVITFIASESGRRYDADDLAVAEDLAHRAGVAIENARLYQEVREADRRKDEFLAVLGHELRNPLAPISNALQVLKMPGANAPVVEQAREMMERQVQHMVRLVDDLLDVSRIVRGKVELRKQPVELATVVARAVETSQPLVEAEGHELTVILPPEPLRVSGDLVRLAQVVGNLLNNAARYTERGGKIRVVGERLGDKAVLRVRDTGIGIAAEVLPRIWEMFVQADRRMKGSHGGMGIGLALVKGLVELHGGTVEAKSDGPGKGSEFAVMLPLLFPQKSDESRSQEGGRPPQAASRRVLVVDDNVDAAESLALLLRLGGHEVRVAYDGPTALQLAEVETPEVAFLDIGMPVMDGYELARRFRERPGLQNVLLIALTGWGQEEDRRRTREAGFEAHEVKPVSPEALDKLLGKRPRASGG